MLVSEGGSGLHGDIEGVFALFHGQGQAGSFRITVLLWDVGILLGFWGSLFAAATLVGKGAGLGDRDGRQSGMSRW